MMFADATIRGDELVDRLVGQVRELADSRELELNLNLGGRPVEVGSRVSGAVTDAVAGALDAAALAPDLHHLGFDLDFRPGELYLKVEHDGALDAGLRRHVEEMAVAIYRGIGALGGAVGFSLGRGFGVRLEITVPYTGSGSTAYPATGRIEPGGLLRLESGERPGQPLVDRLTPQEESCLALLASGFSNKEIATRLHISVGTVKFHLAQIYQKLGVQGRGRGAAVARARELGLIFD
jgi:DNA-binding CsgD family transcriptional regulator